MQLGSEVRNVIGEKHFINHPVLSYAWHVEKKKKKKSLFISASNKQRDKEMIPNRRIFPMPLSSPQSFTPLNEQLFESVKEGC